MKICIAGKNNIAVEALAILLTKVDKTSIMILVNRTDDGKDRFQKSFKKYSIEKGLMISEIEELFDIEDLIFISLEYDRLIKPDLFKSKNLYNIHFSLLPKYKGMYTSFWPLINHENESGVSLHYIDHGIDTGPVIGQRRFLISDDMTARDLYYKYVAEGIELFSSWIDQILSDNVVAEPQTAANSSYYSKNSIDYKNSTINLFQTAVTIKNQVRAFHFREYQLPNILDRKVSHVRILSERSIVRSGTLLEETEWAFKFSTIDYNILVYKDRLDEYFESIENENSEFICNYKLHGYNLLEINLNGVSPLNYAFEMKKNGVIALIESII